MPFQREFYVDPKTGFTFERRRFTGPDVDKMLKVTECPAGHVIAVRWVTDAQGARCMDIGPIPTTASAAPSPGERAGPEGDNLEAKTIKELLTIAGREGVKGLKDDESQPIGGVIAAIRDHRNKKAFANSDKAKELAAAQAKAKAAAAKSNKPVVPVGDPPVPAGA